MNIDYYLINPTENITLLVETPIAREFQPFVASELLKAEPRGEQVGFIRQNDNFDIDVRMAGGEFCGNAAISAAAFYIYKKGEKDCVNVCLSGTPVTVKKLIDSEKFTFSAILNNNAEISKITFTHKGKIYEFPLVTLFGISHIIINKNGLDFSPEEVIKDLCVKINALALGMMVFDFETYELTPYVYVRYGDTLYRENSCASGTASLGAYLFNEFGKKISTDIIEPGGVLNITADREKLVLSGNAFVEYGKKLDITNL